MAVTQSPTTTTIVDNGSPIAPAGLFSDTSDMDRAIVARFFPDAMRKGVAAGEGLWVLFDPEGNILRTGREPLPSA